MLPPSSILVPQFLPVMVIVLLSLSLWCDFRTKGINTNQQTNPEKYIFFFSTALFLPAFPQMSEPDLEEQSPDTRIRASPLVPLDHFGGAKWEFHILRLKVVRFCPSLLTPCVRTVTSRFPLLPDSSTLPSCLFLSLISSLASHRNHLVSLPSEPQIAGQRH